MEIKLTQGKTCQIDACDYDSISQHRWHAWCPNGRTWYAVRTIHGKVRRLMPMARQIMGDPQGMIVDHINGDTLDNRRQNLRIGTKADNNRNRRYSKNPKPYRGTALLPSGRYRARLFHNNYPVHIGVFETEIEAAKAYDRKAMELFGGFAVLNFPAE